MGFIGVGNIRVGLGVASMAVGAGELVVEKVGRAFIGVAGTGVLGTEIMPVDLGTGVSKDEESVPTRMAISSSPKLLSRITSAIIPRLMAGMVGALRFEV